MKQQNKNPKILILNNHINYQIFNKIIPIISNKKIMMNNNKKIIKIIKLNNQ